MTVCAALTVLEHMFACMFMPATTLLKSRQCRQRANNPRAHHITRSGGANDSVAFVLPKGERPSHTLNVPVFSQSGVAGAAIIQRNGGVVLFAGNVTAFASLDAISFVAGE
jgi:hypothetical protein